MDRRDDGRPTALGGEEPRRSIAPGLGVPEAGAELALLATPLSMSSKSAGKATALRGVRFFPGKFGLGRA
jgi:hypothetical protein